MVVFILRLIWISAESRDCGEITAPAAASLTYRRAGHRPEQMDYG